jgi:hypothetical protein
VREVEADVRVGFPGTWRWRVAFLLPAHYAWTIHTTGEPDHYLFDGLAARAFVGTREVAEDRSATNPLRTQARFTAVVNLDALLLPGVRLAPLERAALPPDAIEGLAVVLADDGAQYRLGFDARTRVVHAEGPIALPPLGAGQLVARFGDFRKTGRWVLAYRTEYMLGGQPLASERTIAVCPEPRDLAPEAFRTPSAVPDCSPG